MSKVKLNLVSGSVQEKELITAFNYNNVKYVIFDGESTGSMGLPIILVGKESTGKVVGITDAEEWKNTKDCLKKIIAGEQIDYAAVRNELKADDIYYRQLTLPIASFDILKSSYKAPLEEESSNALPADDTPIFQPITPEEVAQKSPVQVEPVNPSAFTQFTNPVDVNTEVSSTSVNNAPDINSVVNENTSIPETNISNAVDNNPQTQAVNYDELKKEFLIAAETLFDNIFSKFNHND